MIYWITGNSGSGKTTLADLIATAPELQPCVRLDGDLLRACLDDWDFSEKARRLQSSRTDHLAVMLEKQGFNVVISVICPYADQRAHLTSLGRRLIYLPGGESGPDYPYEKDLV